MKNNEFEIFELVSESPNGKYVMIQPLNNYEKRTVISKSIFELEYEEISQKVFRKKLRQLDI